MKIGDGQAIISIEEYDHLREFKKEIMDGNLIRVSGNWDDYFYAVKTIDEAFKDVVDKNNWLGDKNRSLDSENEDLKYKCDSQRIDILRLKSELEDAKKDTFWKWITRK